MSDAQIEWSINVLNAAGFSLEDNSPETIQDTPWSNVCRFRTDKGYVYLKATPPALSIEPNVIQLLRHKFHVSVPVLIEASQERDCFLMNDAGMQLHEYFKSGFDAEILISAIKEYSALQISSMNATDVFFDIGVPDWRLEKLPKLYLALIAREDLLIDDGLSMDDLQQLKNLGSRFNEICDRLSQYQISNTFGHADFHPKNILIDKDTQKTTVIDLGEVVITHPFYSLHNCLHMAKENFSLSDTQYNRILESCLEPWLSLESRANISEIISHIHETWMIHAVLGEMRLIDSVDEQAYKTLRREGRLSKKLRVWIDSH